MLVMGGCGFIGSHVVAQAMKEQYQVTVISKTRTTLCIPTPTLPEILHADITDRERFRKILQNRTFHYVINCSGYIEHTLYQEGGRSVLDQHFSGVLNLIDSLDRSHLEAFVQIGSSDEYGNTLAPQSEEKREAPISPYSFGKVATAQFLQMLHRTENFPATILRIFLVYGPGQGTKRFLPQIIQGCLANQTFPTSQGEQLRDFCYVEDVVDAIFRVLSTPQARGEIINVASGTPISIRKMIETIVQKIKKGNPQFGKYPYRVGENMSLYANIEKAHHLLEWYPQTSLEEGLERTIAFYQQ